MSVAPACVVSSPSIGKACSFVAKVGSPEMLWTFGSAELVGGANGFAVVSTMGSDHYFVITFPERVVIMYQQRLAQRAPC